MQRMLVTMMVGFGLTGMARADKFRDGLAKTLQPVLDSPPATGLMVFEVVPGSQAARNNIKVGDILINYNGQPLTKLNQLVQSASEAIRSNQKQIPVIFQRGNQPLEKIFQPSSLGLKLIPVTKGEPQKLWREATKYKPNYANLSRARAHRQQWEILQQNGKTIGFIHQWLEPPTPGGTYQLRVEERRMVGTNVIKKDWAFSFTQDQFLSPKRIRLHGQDKLILDIVRKDNLWVGTRAGIPVKVKALPDTISAPIAYWLVTTMPRKKGACLAGSYLAGDSLTPAPFSDIFARGWESFTVAGDRKVSAFAFEQTAFGQIVAEYWLDGKGEVLKRRLPDGTEALPCRLATLEKLFPRHREELKRLTYPPTVPAAN